MERWIVGYLPNLYSLQRLFSEQWCERVIAFGKLKKNRSEAVVAYFKVPSKHSPGGTEEYHEKPLSL
jgi:hypothetical protein